MSGVVVPETPLIAKLFSIASWFSLPLFYRLTPDTTELISCSNSSIHPRRHRDPPYIHPIVGIGGT